MWAQIIVLHAAIHRPSVMVTAIIHQGEGEKMARSSCGKYLGSGLGQVSSASAYTDSHLATRCKRCWQVRSNLSVHYYGGRDESKVNSLHSVTPRLEHQVLMCQNTVQEWGHMRRILSTCEKTPRKQDKKLVTSVSSKHGTVLGMRLHAPPRCSG